MKRYNGEFKSRIDIAREFAEGDGDHYGTGTFKPSPTFPKTSDIIYASYETALYEGYAFVLFRQGDKLYEVNGSHCSCCGLEGQWKPEETTWDALAMRSSSWYGTPETVIKSAKRRSAKRRSHDA